MKKALKEEKEYQEPQNEIDMKKQLSLNKIMVLRIGQNNSYLISTLGLDQNNCDERIILNSNKKEKTIIEKCAKANIELERKSIVNYMPSDCIEIYNDALDTGRYDICLTMLRGLGSHLNQISKERKKVLSLKRTNK